MKKNKAIKYNVISRKIFSFVVAICYNKLHNNLQLCSLPLFIFIIILLKENERKTNINKYSNRFNNNVILFNNNNNNNKHFTNI